MWTLRQVKQGLGLPFVHDFIADPCLRQGTGSMIPEMPLMSVCDVAYVRELQQALAKSHIPVAADLSTL